jgi:uncharacterized protein YcbX
VGTQVGTVRSLWRYPVKSMAAEPLRRGELGWNGIPGDRRWAFVRPDSEAMSFPWQTIREQPTMCRYVPSLTDPDRPEASTVDVRTPSGETRRVTDPLLAAELGPGVGLMRLSRGLFDAVPVSLITAGTVSAVCGLAGVRPDPLRFRPNLFVDAEPGQPFAEDAWVGAVLRIGAAEVRFDRQDPRCAVINVDPSTGVPDAPVLKAIPRDRATCAGVYGTVVRPGAVEVGDPVTLVG